MTTREAAYAAGSRVKNGFLQKNRKELHQHSFADDAALFHMAVLGICIFVTSGHVRNSLLCPVFQPHESFLALYSCSGSAHDRFYFFLSRHRGIARRGHGQCAVRCSVVDCKLCVSGSHQTIDQA